LQDAQASARFEGVAAAALHENSADRNTPRLAGWHQGDPDRDKEAEGDHNILTQRRDASLADRSRCKHKMKWRVLVS
jgi:hypothetical protein